MLDLLKSQNSSRVNEIENHFKKLTGHPVLLFSSARNALYSLTEALELNRKNEIYIPPYSALCLYECFGRSLNISTHLLNQEIVLVNHKWGTIQKSTCDLVNQFVIEDSCDAYLTPGSDLFPNGGQVQLVSLPKILGTISGGLLLFKSQDDPLYVRLRDIQKSQNPSSRLILKKWVYYKSKMRFQGDWEQLEFKQKGINWLESLLLLNVLPEYAKNLRTVDERLKAISKLVGARLNQSSYSGPVAILKTENGRLDEDLQFSESIIRKYHLDLSFMNGEKKQYSEVLIFPIHLGVSDSVFAINLKWLEKEAKKLGAIQLIN
jgi:putative PLP-dependent aminotransferase (TIGR04422 family)